MVERELLKQFEKLRQHDHFMIYATEDGVNYKMGVKLENVEAVSISLEEKALIIVPYLFAKPQTFDGVYEIDFIKGLK
jgi:hypothetical protein